MTDGKGTIVNLPAYEQGKNLDNHGWLGQLPRQCTPSDIDLVFDNASKVVYGELNRQHKHWLEIQWTQRWVYENVLIGTENCSVLLYHDVSLDRQIRTYEDVESFHPIVWSADTIVSGGIFHGVRRWQKFIKAWYQNPATIRAIVIRDCVERWPLLWR